MGQLINSHSLAGEALPDDGWEIETIGKILQLTAPETDLLLISAGFEQVYGTQQTASSSSGNQYDMSGDFRGANININSTLENVTQSTGQADFDDPSYWMPPQLKTPFGRHREQWQLLDAYESVQQCGRGQVILLMSKPSYGRHALIKWLTQQESVNQHHVHFVSLSSESKHFNDLAINETRKNAPYPTLFIIENLERGAHWIDDLRRLAQICVDGEENLPILLLVSITSYLPLAEMKGKQHTEPTRFAQKLLQNKLATLIELDHIDEESILRTIAPANPLLAERLYELTEGSPYWCEIIWGEWKAANNLGVAQDEDGVWQAVEDAAGNLTIYASVAEQVRNQLEDMLFGWEDMEPPYSLEEAATILQCAATEGERFTLDAVAAVLELNRDELLDFFADFLEPYVDEDTPENNTPGMVEWGSVQVDSVDPTQTPYSVRMLVEYKFTRPYLYYAWRKYPPLKAERAAWKVFLGGELERLYWPYGEKIVEKLELLAPKLAAPYRQRQGKQATLDQLRYQVHMLRTEDKQDAYTAYRLFDTGIKLLGRLASEAPSTWEEGVELAQDLHQRATHWQDVEFEAKIERLWGWHLQNGGHYSKALPHNKRAVRLCKEEGLSQLFYSASLSNLGGLLQAMGNLAEARPYYERALAIREKALAPDHPDTATSLNNLGGLLRAMGELAEARPYYERALAIREKALGPDHPDTAQSLNNLGFLLQAMGELADARPYYERALAINEKALGPDHPNTNIVRDNLQSLP